MSNFTNYSLPTILDRVWGGVDGAVPANWFLALFTVAPTNAGGGTEVAGGAYARVEVANNAGNFPATAGNQKSNANAIVWPIATANWGTIVAFGFFDAANGGNLWAWAPVSNPPTINTADSFQLAPGDFSASF